VTGPILALIVAAGRGSRAGTGVPKQYRPLGGMPVLRRTALAFLSHPRVDLVRVVIHADDEALYRDSVGDLALSAKVIGGETRQDSVAKGLAAAGDAREGIVLIHDAARPFLPAAVIDRLLAALERSDAAVPVLPVVDTLAHAADGLGAVVPRDDLVRVQTPQAFRLQAILDAHAAWSGDPATDDAQVARAAGLAVATVAGDPMLEKLTHDADFARAEAGYAAQMTSRTGLGFDVHAFAPGSGVRLGGISIPHDRSLAGHSDADVVLHAVTDALLGAIGEGDIGDHFPPGDARWSGAPSSGFVDHARGLIEARGGLIDHIDVTLICEAPRIGPHRPAMRQALAALLRLPLERISIKATTTEGLGFAGRGEGIAAQAVATVRLPEDR
jgi:2-C-methyl-D-erythritol 4-phosphate cytidylyltransferase/2-C-methyl-D-erythritol 2,4-cyclodiphosphate synthase